MMVVFVVVLVVVERESTAAWWSWDGEDKVGLVSPSDGSVRTVSRCRVRFDRPTQTTPPWLDSTRVVVVVVVVPGECDMALWRSSIPSGGWLRCDDNNDDNDDDHHSFLTIVVTETNMVIKMIILTIHCRQTLDPAAPAPSQETSHDPVPVRPWVVAAVAAAVVATGCCCCCCLPRLVRSSIVEERLLAVLYMGLNRCFMIVTFFFC